MYFFAHFLSNQKVNVKRPQSRDKIEFNFSFEMKLGYNLFYTSDTIQVKV